MGNDWGTEIHCSCRNSSEQIIKSSPSSTVTLSFLDNPAAFSPTPAHSFLQSVPQVTTSFPLRSSLPFYPCLLLAKLGGWTQPVPCHPFLPGSPNPRACPHCPRALVGNLTRPAQGEAFHVQQFLIPCIIDHNWLLNHRNTSSELPDEAWQPLAWLMSLSPAAWRLRHTFCLPIFAKSKPNFPWTGRRALMACRKKHTNKRIRAPWSGLREL